MSDNYPAGVTSNDPEFNLPSVDDPCQHEHVDYLSLVPQCQDCGWFIPEQMVEAEPAWGWAVTPTGEVIYL